MAATETDAGNFVIFSGTLSDIADAIKGFPKDNILGFTHDGTNYIVLCARK